MAKKNLQFLFNLHETWPKLLSCWLIILPKFRGDWIKIVDFLLMVNFWQCPIFFSQTLCIVSQIKKSFESVFFDVFLPHIRGNLENGM